MKKIQDLKKTYYTQGENDNTCGVIALLNALTFYNKPIPPKEEIKKIIDKYNVKHGTSPQDIHCIAHELGLHLSSIKITKENIVKILENKIPILLSGFIAVDTENQRPCKNIRSTCVDFKLGRCEVKAFPSLGKTPVQIPRPINPFINPAKMQYTGCHTVAITSYDKKHDSFLTHNVCFNHVKLNFNNFIFGLGDNGEKWDTCFFITLSPIKLDGFPKLKA